MRLVQRRLEVHAAVGEREALAPAQPLAGQFQPVRAVFRPDLGIDQPQGIDAGGLLEQHAARVPRPALGMVERPGRIARRRLQRPARVRLVGEPAEHGRGECLLLHRHRHMGPQRRLDGLSVKVRRLGRLDRPGGAALHEQPLAAIDRRQRGVAPGQRRRFRLDPEQAGEKPFQPGRQSQHQLRFRLRLQRVRRRAGGFEFRPERCVEALQEQRVEPEQPVAAIQILKEETVSKGQFGHGGRITSRSGARPVLPGTARLSN